MLRHYIEGLACAALAVSFSVEASRRGRATFQVLSSLFYFLAMLEKEVYVPLIVLLFFLQEGDARSRARNLRPHALALIAYLAWRWTMLGTLLGGYDLANRPGELPGLAAGLPGRLVGTFLGDLGPAAAILLAPLVVGIAWLVWRHPATLAILAGATLLIVGPIVPVAKTVNERFGALPWLLAVVAFVFGCRSLASGSRAGRWAAAALITLAAGAAFVANRLDWRVRYAAAERMSAEGRFFLSMAPGDLLRAPRVPPAAMTETRWLKEERLNLPAGAGWFADDVFLCGGVRRGRIWEYLESEGRVADVTARVSQAARRHCAGLRQDVCSLCDVRSLRRRRFLVARALRRGDVCARLRRRSGFAARRPSRWLPDAVEALDADGPLRLSLGMGDLFASSDHGFPKGEAVSLATG